MNRRELFKSGLSALLAAACGIGPERQITDGLSRIRAYEKYPVTLPRAASFDIVLSFGPKGDTPPTDTPAVRVKLLDAYMPEIRVEGPGPDNGYW